MIEKIESSFSGLNPTKQYAVKEILKVYQMPHDTFYGVIDDSGNYVRVPQDQVTKFIEKAETVITP